MGGHKYRHIIQLRCRTLVGETSLKESLLLIVRMWSAARFGVLELMVNGTLTEGINPRILLDRCASR
jgi:hypothetical protein